MARFNMEESKNYGNTGGGNFFSLKDDKEVARVRFLINDINDLYGVSCHEVDVNGRKVDVECLRAYNEPVDNCPLCTEGYEVHAKLFIPLYIEKTQESKIWTRGKAYFDKLAGFCARYNPLVATTFDIERHGKKGDTNTTYEIYPIATDNKRITDFPEIQLEGTAFQTKTYEELDNYLNTGSFDLPQQRNNRPVENRQAQREVPANNQPIRRRPTYNEEDNF